MGTGFATNLASTHIHAPIKGLHFKEGNRRSPHRSATPIWSPQTPSFHSLEYLSPKLPQKKFGLILEK